MRAEEYLAGEKLAETKSEYVAGEVYAMAGGTPEHSAIATEIRRLVGNQLSGAGCEVYDSDLKVRVADAGPFFYPDASIVGGNAQFDSGDCLRNPTAIVEVLSPSTGAFDRGDKFFHYRRIASMRHYVLVEQDRMLVEHFALLDGRWTLVGEHTLPEDRLQVPEMGVSVPLSDIYRRVPLPAPAAVTPEG